MAGDANGPHSKQLQMLWPEARLADPPEASAGSGYVLRQIKPPDVESYLKVMHGAGFSEFNHEKTARLMRTCVPGGYFVIEHEASGEIVASTVATHEPSELHPCGGELGWVAASPEHSGKGLGMAVCAAVTARFLSAGYRRLYLKTDDWRLPAIKIYLKLGWVPYLFEPDMHDRWKAVCETLKWPFTPEDWPRRDGAVA